MEDRDRRFGRGPEVGDLGVRSGELGRQGGHLLLCVGTACGQSVALGLQRLHPRSSRGPDAIGATPRRRCGGPRPCCRSRPGTCCDAGCGSASRAGRACLLLDLGARAGEVERACVVTDHDLEDAVVVDVHVPGVADHPECVHQQDNGGDAQRRAQPMSSRRVPSMASGRRPRRSQCGEDRDDRHDPAAALGVVGWCLPVVTSRLAARARARAPPRARASGSGESSTTRDHGPRRPPVLVLVLVGSEVLVEVLVHDLLGGLVDVGLGEHRTGQRVEVVAPRPAPRPRLPASAAASGRPGNGRAPGHEPAQRSRSVLAISAPSSAASASGSVSVPPRLGLGGEVTWSVAAPPPPP